MATLRQMWMILTTIVCACHYVAFAKESKIDSTEENIRSEIFSGYSVLQRPVSNLSETVTVSMSMGLATMHNFIEKEQIMSSTAYIQLRWIDPRLKWNPDDYNGIELIPVSPYEVWLPKLTVFNAVSQGALTVVDKDIGEILLTFKGEVNLGMPFQQSTLCPVQVLYFPFDKQVCPLYFGFQNLLQSLGRLEIFGSYLLPFQTSNQWEVTSITGEVSSFGIPNTTSTEETGLRSFAVFCVYMERNPSYYITTLIIPSICLYLLALMTFLAPPDSGERISLSVSIVLGMTVFQLLMFDLLPISNEHCLLSSYLSTNFILVTLTVPLSLLNINLVYGDRSHNLLQKRWFRVLMLELLPKVLCVPSLSQRLPKNKVSTQNLTLENVASSEFSEESPRVNGKVNDDLSDMNVDRDEQDEHMGGLESRTLAIVWDRLIFFVFFSAFVVKGIWLIFDYSGQGELQHQF